MIEDKIRDEVGTAVDILFPTLKFKHTDIEVSRTKNPEFGDFSTNVAFKLAGQLGKKPFEVAETIKEEISRWHQVEKAEVANGFVNIFLKKAMFHDILAEILDKKEHFADSDELSGQKIQVEFISANPTGPLTLANGRGGFAGDVLANVFSKTGAEVEREYYVNDGGNQINILGKSLLYLAEGEDTAEEDTYKGDYIAELLDWYRDEEKFQKWVSSKDVTEIGRMAAADLLEKMIKPSVAKMNIHFDKWYSEREMIGRGEVENSIENLKKYGHTYEKDGALWLSTSKAGDDKDRVLIKVDGEKTYFANDIAYHHDKFYNRKFNRVVDFWGADHHGYVGRMLAAMDLTVGTVGELKIVIMQMVRLIKDGQEYKMSKRKGTYVTMDDLLTLIGGDDAADVARFFFLSRSFNTHMDFDLDLAREHSDKNPVFYAKYAYARICSILRKSKDLKLPEADLSLLAAPEEVELIDEMSQLPALITSIIRFDEYPVHYLTFYVLELAKKFHSFYDKCRVIDEDNLELTAARLKLVEATAIVLKIVMEDLIGIEAPEKM